MMDVAHAIEDYVELLLAPPVAAGAPSPVPSAASLPPPPAVPESQAPAPAAAASARAGHVARWLRLRCGEQACALELLKIREVMLPVPMLPLRGADPAVSGVINLRGQVVPVVDLGLHFGGQPVEATPATRIVVLEHGNAVLGLRVSGVEEIIVIDPATIEDARVSQLAPVGDQRIRGIARPAGRVVLLLDAARLLATPLH